MKRTLITAILIPVGLAIMPAYRLNKWLSIYLPLLQKQVRLSKIGGMYIMEDMR
jgi:hypothetical protein